MNFRKKLKARREHVNQRQDTLKRLDSSKGLSADFVQSQIKATDFGSTILQHTKDIRDQGVSETDYSQIDKYAEDLIKVKSFAGKELNKSNALQALEVLYPKVDVKAFDEAGFFGKPESNEDISDSSSEVSFLKNILSRLDNFPPKTIDPGDIERRDFNELIKAFADLFHPPHTSETIQLAKKFSSYPNLTTTAQERLSLQERKDHFSPEKYSDYQDVVMSKLIQEVELDSGYFHIPRKHLELIIDKDSSGDSQVFLNKNDFFSKGVLPAFSDEHYKEFMIALYNSISNSESSHDKTDILLSFTKDSLESKSTILSQFFPQAEEKVDAHDTDSTTQESFALATVTNNEEHENISDMSVFEKLAYIRLIQLHDGQTNLQFSYGKAIIDALKQDLPVNIDLINAKYAKLMEFAGVTVENASEAASEINPEDVQSAQTLLESIGSMLTSFMVTRPEETTTSNEEAKTSNESNTVIGVISSFFGSLFPTTEDDNTAATPQNAGETTPQNSGETTPQNSGETTPQNSGETTPQNADETTSQNTFEATPQNSVSTYITFDKEVFNESLNKNALYIAQSLYAAGKVGCFKAAAQFTSDATSCQVHNAGSDKTVDYCKPFLTAAENAETFCVDMFKYDTNRDETIIKLLEELSKLEMGDAGELYSAHAEGAGISGVQKAAEFLALPQNQPTLELGDVEELPSHHQGSDRTLSGSEEDILLLGNSDSAEEL